MTKEIICVTRFMCLVCVVMCLQACRQSVVIARPERHLAELHKNGADLYIDRIDSRLVMKADSYDTYVAYKVDFRDSVQGDKKLEQERNVYYDYKMANDWKVVVDSDTISPVFYQPVTGLNAMNKEGVLVFELPVGKHPDALLYDDSFGDWQKQFIALNPTLK
ncbi:MULTISPECIES: DUF4352 domain-containing protein [Niastella]|uniref:Uncharacterized protein n=1 Tax=Niastella soli TaxID=2821487 RepID=A0ABS3Z2L8_9BACT|nr:hypothetical protein [Niastella soli]MBO9203997.1 hypothetical protein [Niastella soli]